MREKTHTINVYNKLPVTVFISSLSSRSLITDCSINGEFPNLATMEKPIDYCSPWRLHLRFVVAKRLLRWRLEGLRGVVCSAEVRTSEVVVNREVRQPLTSSITLFACKARHDTISQHTIQTLISTYSYQSCRHRLRRNALKRRHNRLDQPLVVEINPINGSLPHRPVPIRNRKPMVRDIPIVRSRHLDNRTMPCR